jgi:ribosomal protein S18 acetylase RimI-like enzyme
MTPDALLHLLEATWPAARTWQQGAVTLRDGAGGGQRVSAASVQDGFAEQDIVAAEAAMAHPLFLVREGQDALDRALAGRGYRLHDPVVAYAADIGALTGDLPPLAAFPHWPPLRISCGIWDEGGIGVARINVMERVQGPKTAILARHADRPAGVAFVALAGTDAMVHALEVRPAHRRMGVGRSAMRAAANWAAAQGATRLALVVTERNAGARALYAALGMTVVGRYHYRIRQMDQGGRHAG